MSPDKEVSIVNGLEVAQPGPEVAHYPAHPFTVPHPVTGYATVPVAVPSAVPSKTICGLRKVTFLLSIAIATLVVVVVGVAIGLGVGLSQAHSNARGSDSSAASAATTSPSSSTSPPTSSSMTFTNTPPPTATPTSTSSSSSLSISCPGSNNTVQTIDSSSVSYRILCDTDLSGNSKKTLASFVMNSLGDCLEMCNSMNYFQDRSDVGATYNREGTGGQTPGTCWCLGGTKETETNEGNDCAVPQ